MKNKKATKLTPLMSQYFQMKSKYRDAMLLFRVGDFYETFGEDAVRASETLGIVLTSRNNGGSDIELAGFPHHSLDVYLPKLVKAGYRVAICEQLEKPSREKKVVKRGVTELITPGVNNYQELLDNKSNNFLASIHVFGKSYGLGILDSSTGEFLCYEGTMEAVSKVCQRFNPAEIIYARDKEGQVHPFLNNHTYGYALDDWVYTEEYATDKLLMHFEMPSLKGFGVDEMKLAHVACGAVLHYLESTENNNLKHINRLKRIHPESSMWLDAFTIQNLELLQSNSNTGSSLLNILDRTVSPTGARLLKRWLTFPLTATHAINRRLDLVELFRKHDLLREEIITLIRKIGDLERLIARVPNGKANPKIIKQLGVSLDAVAKIQQVIQSSGLQLLNEYADQLQTYDALREKIHQTLSENPPVQIGKGQTINSGVNSALDEWRHISQNSKNILVEIQQKEAKATGIANLKIGFNNVFGYYLEVTNKYKGQGLVPDEWIRKQTLTNSERYITQELKELEEKILQSQEEIERLEHEVFEDLVASVFPYIPSIQNSSSLVAELDCLINLAVISISYDYNRPEIDDGLVIDIKDGRHPVIEQELPIGEAYIPNSISLSPDEQQIVIITGPNMSGKSAALRQCALICLMAQIGSYVPAQHANIGIIDRIFTRVGASDNISSGESTFMVEMNETASILNNVSPRSLIILDEIGRGTSTFDGISIAWSIVEYLHNLEEVRPKTLFATHYHELNELTNTLPRVKNYHVSTKEIGHKVIFMRKLLPGGTNHSFGIHVARMAGMPGEILNRAQEVLHRLEEHTIADHIKGTVSNIPPSQNYQLNIFESVDETAGAIKAKLEALDLNTMTPIECMLVLKELLQLLEEEAVN